MPKATSSHILVTTEQECLDLKTKLENGADFSQLARQHSKCPSGASGGNLGANDKGRMVPEFDNAVFTGELNTILGPVKTQFGYHLIKVTDRTD